MKTINNIFKIALLITAIVFSISSFAQAPNKMSYQAVIRDASNNLVANQSVGVRISILKGSASGSSVFVETHSATTNANGLVSVEIGNGTNVSGSISGINWGTDAYFIKTETDPTGGTSYSISATNQLLSVPYALSSKSATNMELKDLTDVTGTPTAGQVLKWDGTTWKPQNDLTGGSGGSYSAGAGITISGSNVISADLGTDIATSEIQNNAVTTAKIANDAITAPKIDDMGATSGQVMQYNGTNWAPATPATGSTYTAGSGIAISGSNAISATLGTDISTAEIQNNAVTTAKIATNAVTGNEIANNAVNTAQLANDAVTAPKIAQMSATSGEVLKWNGSAWAPAADNTGSASYTAGSGIAISGSNAISATLGTDISTAEIQNNAVTTAKIATNAVTGNEIANNAVNTAQLANDAVTAPKIDDMGATSGQVLQYNGTNWAPTTPAATTSPWTVSGSNVYRNSGNVGIGTTNPLSPLQVDGQAVINQDGNALQLRGLNPYLSFYNGGINTGFLSSNPTAFDMTTPFGSTKNLTLSTLLTPRLTIIPTGEIGIGTATPTHTLEISSSSAATDVLYVENTTSASGSTAIKGRSVVNGPTAGALGVQGSIDYDGILDLDIVGNEIGVLGYSTGGSVTDNYGVYGHSNGIGVGGFSSSATQAAIFADNTSTGPSLVTGSGFVGINNSSPTARLHINQGGQTVGLGLRFSDGTANSDWDITHGYSLRFHYGGVIKGYITATTGAYVQSSDERLKSNIQDLSPTLDKIMLLNPKSYFYTDDITKTQTIGLLAQETKNIMPELVYYSEVDNLYGIDYSAFSVVAIKAIQEQQAIINSQQTQIDNQQKQIDELKALIMNK